MDQTFTDQQANDERLYVKFYMGARPNDEKTLEAGHPIFDEVPFVRIIVPGDRNTVIDTTVDNTHKTRFPRAWAQFQANAEQTCSGMPIREWPAITRSVAEELAHLNVHTVEQLAELADVFGARIMGFHDLRRKAVAFVALSKDTSHVQKLAAANQALQTQIDALTAQVAEQAKMFDAMTTGKRNDQQHSPANSPNRSK